MINGIISIIILTFVFGFNLGILAHETIRRLKAIKKIEQNQYYVGVNDEYIDKEDWL